MDHVAIMKKSWKLTDKILSGEKTVESRWYKTRRKPWGEICAGETIYFKDSGEPVSVSAKVSKVMQFQDLDSKKVEKLLEKYGKDIGIKTADFGAWMRLFKDKNYCMLIFLEEPRRVAPIVIDKSGYGIMTSWITVDKIEHIKFG